MIQPILNADHALTDEIKPAPSSQLAHHEQQEFMTALSEGTQLTKPVSLAHRLFTKSLADTKRGSLLMYWPDTKQYQWIGKALSVQEIKQSTPASQDGHVTKPAYIEVNDNSFFEMCLFYGEIGFGEAYELGLWQSRDVHRVLDFFLANADTAPTFSANLAKTIIVNCLGVVNRIKHILRPNSVKTSRRNISDHYDLSNDFFKLMLDPTMAYSAAYYKTGTEDLETAQKQKFDVICRKLNLGPNDHLLEIGTGWGGFAVYAAENYGCRITTTTISKAQYEIAQVRIKEAGLAERIELITQDYRALSGKYDKIVSIEMVEALGYKYFDTFFAQCQKLLKPNGLILIQAITFPDPWFKKYLKNTDWIQKHIFPGSLLLCLTEILKSLGRTGNLMVQDVESIGQHYAITLNEWRQRLEAGKEAVKEMGLDDKFIRRFRYYLAYCEVGFAQNYINDLQIVFTRPHNPNIKGI